MSVKSIQSIHLPSSSSCSLYETIFDELNQFSIYQCSQKAFTYRFVTDIIKTKLSEIKDEIIIQIPVSIAPLLEELHLALILIPYNNSLSPAETMVEAENSSLVKTQISDRNSHDQER